MRNIVRSSLEWIMCLGAVSCAIAQNAGEAQRPLTDEQLQVFAVLDEVDNTDTSKLPFVRISWQPSKENRRHQQLGYIVRSDDRVTRILHLNGSHSTIAKQRGKDADLGVVITPLDIEELLAGMITRAASQRDYPQRLRLRMLLFTRAVARAGNHELVHRAWEVLPDRLIEAQSLRTHGDDHSLARFRSRGLALDFADPERTPEQLQQRHAHWLKVFPAVRVGAAGGKKGALRRANAQGLDALRKRISARAEKIRSSMRALELFRQSGASAQEKLIFELRDARRLPDSHWKILGLDISTHTTTTTPIQDRIASQDLAIVPFLLKALDSYDMTRCHSGVDRPLRFFTVKELADRLLQRIAGYTPTGKDPAKRWRAWHESVQATSLRKVMEKELKQHNYQVITPYLKRWPKQWPRVITVMEAPEKNITAILALLRGLPPQLPRQALVASERVFASNTMMMFKQMVAQELAKHTAPTGENALDKVLQSTSINAKTRHHLQRNR